MSKVTKFKQARVNGGSNFDSLEVDQMLRHLISDAHERINEIPIVPINYPAKPQPRERAWDNQRGKKTLLSLTPVRLCDDLRGVGKVGALALVKYHHLS